MCIHINVNGLLATPHCGTLGVGEGDFICAPDYTAIFWAFVSLVLSFLPACPFLLYFLSLCLSILSLVYLFSLSIYYICLSFLSVCMCALHIFKVTVPAWDVLVWVLLIWNPVHAPPYQNIVPRFGLYLIKYFMYCWVKRFLSLVSPNPGMDA